MAALKEFREFGQILQNSRKFVFENSMRKVYYIILYSMILFS